MENKFLILVLIGFAISSCDKTDNLESTNAIAQKLNSLNERKIHEVIGLHSAMTAEIYKIRNENNSKKLDSIPAIPDL